jgi:hypothetical protein
LVLDLAIQENNVWTITKRLVVSFVLASLIAFSGCSEKFQESDLIGMYVLNTGPGVNTLELKVDGTYVYTYGENGFTKINITGKWELEKTYYGQVVTLAHFRPRGEGTKDYGYYLLTPNRFFGSIRLVRDEDVNEFYKKE